MSRTRKRRSKTFTGCWTCRMRHVNCDEKKPACLRCEKADIHCEGYALRLSWPDSQSSSRHSATGTVAASGSPSLRGLQVSHPAALCDHQTSPTTVQHPYPQPNFDPQQTDCDVLTEQVGSTRQDQDLEIDAISRSKSSRYGTFLSQLAGSGIQDVNDHSFAYLDSIHSQHGETLSKGVTIHAGKGDCKFTVHDSFEGGNDKKDALTGDIYIPKQLNKT